VPEEEMMNRLLTPALCALAIFVIGAGIEPVTAGDREADPTAYAQVLSGEASLRMMPTVTVLANASDAADVADIDPESSVVLAGVQKAGDSLARNVHASVRRVSLSVPYYAFGGVARRASE
jgi:hypothetical protein